MLAKDRPTFLASLLEKDWRGVLFTEEGRRLLMMMWTMSSGSHGYLVVMWRRAAERAKKVRRAFRFPASVLALPQVSIINCAISLASSPLSSRLSYSLRFAKQSWALHKLLMLPWNITALVTASGMWPFKSVWNTRSKAITSSPSRVMRKARKLSARTTPERGGAEEWVVGNTATMNWEGLICFQIVLLTPSRSLIGRGIRTLW